MVGYKIFFSMATIEKSASWADVMSDEEILTSNKSKRLYPSTGIGSRRTNKRSVVKIAIDLPSPSQLTFMSRA